MKAARPIWASRISDLGARTLKRWPFALFLVACCVPHVAEAKDEEDKDRIIKGNLVVTQDAAIAGVVSAAQFVATGGTMTTAAATGLTLSGGNHGASLTLQPGPNGGSALTNNGAGFTTVRDGSSNGLELHAGPLLATIQAYNRGSSSYLPISYDASSHSFLITGREAARFAPTSGNLLVGGTADIGGSGGLKVFGTTAATSTTTGALQVVGGLGVGGAGFFGNALTVTGDNPSVVIESGTGPGRLVFKNSSATSQVWQLGDSGNDAAQRSFSLDDASAGATRLRIDHITGTVNLPTNVPSTSTTSGSLVVAGGVGVGGNVNAAGDLAGASVIARGSTAAFWLGDRAIENWSTDSLRLVRSGGVTSFVNRVSNADSTPLQLSSASVIVATATASTGKDSGALVVKGGAGIEGNLNVGGTISAPAWSSGTLTGGTSGLTISAGGTGNQNIVLAPTGAGNVRIDSQGASGADTRLLRLAVNQAAAGSSASLEFASAGDEALGQVRGGVENGTNGFLAFSTRSGSAGEKEQVRITSAGNVGIGTANPAGTLHVVSATAQTNTPGAGIFLGKSLGNDYELQLTQTGGVPHIDLSRGANADFDARLSAPADNTLSLSTATAPDLLNLAGANVGIGTSTPGAKLEVAGTVKLSGDVMINSATLSTDSATGALVVTGGIGVGGRANINDSLTVGSGADVTTVAAGTVTTSGAVNAATLATSSSAAIGGTLTVIRAATFADATAFKGPATFDGTATFNNPAAFNSTTTFAGPAAFDNAAAFSGLATFGGRLQVGAAGLNMATGDFALSSAGALKLSTSSQDIIYSTQGATERMRVTSAGNVGIGTSAPMAMLDVAGDIKANGAISVATLNLAGVRFDPADYVKMSGATMPGSLTAAALTASGGTISGGATGLTISSGAANTDVVLDGVGQGRVEVRDTLAITNAAGIQELLMGNQDGSGENHPAILRASNGNIEFGSGDSWVGQGGTFTSKVMLLDNGNVGIGTATPGAKLEVAGTTKLSGDVVITSGTGSTDATTGALVVSGGVGVTGKANISESLTVGSGSDATTMAAGTVTTSGAVNAAALATSSNATIGGTLTVAQTATFADATVFNGPAAFKSTTAFSGAATFDSTASFSGVVAFGGRLQASGGGLAMTAGDFTVASAGTLKFSTATQDIVYSTMGGAERMRLTSAGNVGIGTSAPTAMLDVAGDVKARGTLSVGGLTLAGQRFDPADYVKLSGATMTGGLTASTLAASGGSITGGAAGLTISSGAANTNIVLDGADSGRVEVRDVLAITNATGVQSLLIGNQDQGGANHPAILRSNNGTIEVGTGDSWVGPGGAFTAKLTLLDNGNLGVGTTTPGARLDVRSTSGSAVLGATTAINAWGGEFHNGGGGADRYVQLAGSEHAALFMNGNVGIGTTTPSAKLVVAESPSGASYPADAIAVFERGSDGVVAIAGSGASTTAYLFSNAGNARDAGLLYDNGRRLLSLRAAGNDSLTITSAGNVGIGTATPGQALDVAGSAAIAGAVQFTHATGGDGFLSVDSGRILRWRNANASTPNWDLVAFETGSGLFRKNVLVDGNVGIGTSTPGARLEVAGTAQINGLFTALAGARIDGLTSMQTAAIAGTSSYGGALTFVSAGSNAPAGSLSWGAGATDPLVMSGGTGRGLLFAVDATLAKSLMIAPNGNVGIGQANPSEKLVVEGNIALSQPGALTSGPSGGAKHSLVQADANNDIVVGGSGAPWQNIRFYSAAAERMTVAASGNVGIGTTTPTAKLEVNGDVKASGDVSATKLNSSSNAAIGGNLAVAQAATFASTSSFAGAATFSNTSSFGGAATFANTSSFMGAATFSGTARFGGEATFNNKSTFTGDAAFGSGATFAGTATFGNRLQASADGLNMTSGDLKLSSAGNAVIATAGSIVFSTPAETERVRITTDGSVGIGTSTPDANLTIQNNEADENVPRTLLSLVGPNNTGVGYETRFIKSDEGGAAPLYINTGYNGAFNHEVKFGNANSGGAQPSLQTFNATYLATAGGSVGIATTNPDPNSAVKLAVNGAIHAKEVIVDLSVAANELKVRPHAWADVVFEDNYKNAPLSEVEAHIKEHKHLPGVPSAAEVAARGVDVGQMQTVLLQKIEELTLHMIQMEKENTALRNRVEQLESAVK